MILTDAALSFSNAKLTQPGTQITQCKVQTHSLRFLRRSTILRLLLRHLRRRRCYRRLLRRPWWPAAARPPESKDENSS